MKKFTLLSLFAFCAILVNAQNLLTNPSLESWTSGKPDGWTVTLPTTAGSSISQDATTVSDGSSSAKFVATGTCGLGQTITLTEGKKYTLSFSYYVEAGDGTDVRIWSNFMSSATGGTYWPMATADSLALKGPGGNTSTAYFPDAKGQWNTYTVDVTVPTGYPVLSLLVRTYSKATAYWDKFSLVEKVESGINTESSKTVAPYVSNKMLYSSAEDGTVAYVYNTLGQKIATTKIENGQASLSAISKGLYVVKVGNSSSKVLVK